MYLDVLGLVTVAIGNLIDPISTALGLPFRKTNGNLASRDEIAAEWQRLKADPHAASLGYRYAQRMTTLRLDPDGISSLVLGKLDSNNTELRLRFPDFEDWPADAQLATHSMAWACGPAFHFPALALALRAHDWMKAADEAHINTTNNPGVVPRNMANRMLYRNASLAADPDVLYWPRDLGEASIDKGPDTEPDPDAPTRPDLAVEVIHPWIYRDDEPPSAA